MYSTITSPSSTGIMFTDPVLTAVAMKFVQSRSVAVGPAEEIAMEELTRFTCWACTSENSLVWESQVFNRAPKAEIASRKNMEMTTAPGITVVMNFVQLYAPDA